MSCAACIGSGHAPEQMASVCRDDQFLLQSNHESHAAGVRRRQESIASSIVVGIGVDVHAEELQVLDNLRVPASFSPMPAVKTIASSSPTAAAHAPTYLHTIAEDLEGLLGVSAALADGNLDVTYIVRDAAQSEEPALLVQDGVDLAEAETAGLSEERAIAGSISPERVPGRRNPWLGETHRGIDARLGLMTAAMEHPLPR